jgi:hypothetical protein
MVSIMEPGRTLQAHRRMSAAHAKVTARKLSRSHRAKTNDAISSTLSKILSKSHRSPGGPGGRAGVVVGALICDDVN